MPRPRRVILASLKKKGFEVHEGDHTFLAYVMQDGRQTCLVTKLSHSGKDVSKILVGKMARQCGLTVREFHDLVDCPLS